MSPAFQEPLMPSMTRDSLFALVATYLALGSRDIENDYANIPIVGGKKVFDLTGYMLTAAQAEGIATQYPIVRREKNDTLETPGVSIYFGDDTPINDRAKPQITELPMMIHTCVEYSKTRSIAGDLALRISGMISDAFETMGCRLQVYNFRIAPPSPVPNRCVSWAFRPRPGSRETADPQSELFTNRISNLAMRYAR